MPVVLRCPYTVSNHRPTLASGMLQAALCLGLAFCGRCAPAAAEEPTLRVGSPAPVLAFKDCRGASHTIDWSTGIP